MALANVEAYLESLPGGIDAHAASLHKGEPLAVWLERSPTAGLASLLPAPVAELLEPRREFPRWVPEVHANVLYLAIRDAHFADDAAFLAHSQACNRAVLQTPTNRVLFWVAAPRAILRAAGLRWSALHRGSALDVRITGDRSAVVTLRYPTRLYPRLVLRGIETAFVAALENAGAKEVRVALVEVGEERAVFEGAWR